MTEAEIRASIAKQLVCPDCPAEIKITFGAACYARVIHVATCPWWLQHQGDSHPVMCIPCGVRTVTHRGPYVRQAAK